MLLINPSFDLSTDRCRVIPIEHKVNTLFTSEKQVGTNFGK